MPAMNIRTKLFPIPVFSQLLLMILAALVGTGAYYTFTKSFYDDYKVALGEAQVIESILSNYGESATTTEQKFVNHLTPRDFSILFIEAGIEKEKDLEKAIDILDVQKNGVGSWLTNKILGTTSLSGARLHELLLGNPSVNLSGCEAPNTPNTVGTLSAMMALFAELGMNGDTETETPDDPCDVFRPSINERATSLVKALAGEPPHAIALMELVGEPEKFRLQDIIKNHMQVLWGIYDGIDINENTDIQTYKYTKESGYEAFVEKEVTDTKWYKINKNASQLQEGIFMLGNLLIKEVLRDPTVQTERFFYKAFKGPIQWLLFMFIFYIFFLLVWRWIAAMRQKQTASSSLLLLEPVLVEGKVEDIDRNMAASRTLIDQLISVCPLLGLFGTVVGIMLGLPEAAGVVMGGSSDVSSLFEQLGLAFSTTAIAVAGVIVLESLWEQLQSYEDHSVWHLTESGNAREG